MASRSYNAGKSAICNLQSKMVVGLIGGIGSGKSSLGAAFAKHRARLISGDVLGHEALRQPEIKKEIVKRWGAQVLDKEGAIDRRTLGTIVFADAEERKKLEALVHLYIKRRLGAEIAAAQEDRSVAFIVIDAAVMLETGWSKECDRIVYVDAPREVRLNRLGRQRGWSCKDVEAREQAQMPLAEKKARADVVLDNSGSLEQLQEQVDKLLKQWGIEK